MPGCAHDISQLDEMGDAPPHGRARQPGLAAEDTHVAAAAVLLRQEDVNANQRQLDSVKKFRFSEIVPLHVAE